jgi:hypothetical protein
MHHNDYNVEEPTPACHNMALERNSLSAERDSPDRHIPDRHKAGLAQKLSSSPPPSRLPLLLRQMGGKVD